MFTQQECLRIPVLILIKSCETIGHIIVTHFEVIVIWINRTRFTIGWRNRYTMDKNSYCNHNKYFNLVVASLIERSGQIILISVMKDYAVPSNPPLHCKPYWSTVLIATSHAHTLMVTRLLAGKYP